MPWAMLPSAYDAIGNLTAATAPFSLAANLLTNPGFEDVSGTMPRHTAMGRVQATERVVHPFGLTYRGTGLYVIGHCELRGEMRSFRVNRIESVQVLPATFERPADFDLEAYLSQVWGIEGGPPMEVRIRYDPGVAQLAKETQWHPSQRLHQEPDGSVVLEMRVKGKTVDQTREILLTKHTWSAAAAA